ncbi:hypothetical protein GVAV_000481, partial [Gurleya vavrai]
SRKQSIFSSDTLKSDNLNTKNSRYQPNIEKNTIKNSSDHLITQKKKKEHTPTQFSNNQKQILEKTNTEEKQDTSNSKIQNLTDTVLPDVPKQSLDKQTDFEIKIFKKAEIKKDPAL